jgi:prepilin signal peptidase PulO-like enzyme (type II secretory pathway)
MGSFLIYGISIDTIISIIISSVFICVIISDAKYMIILDEVLIAGIVLTTICFVIKYGMVAVAYKYLHGLLLFSLMLLIKVFGDVTFKQESLGWGDIKLSFFVGIVLGVKLGVLYIFMGAFLALPYALYVSFKNKSNILPFGPFLISAFYIIFHFSDFFYDLITKLYGGIL